MHLPKLTTILAVCILCSSFSLRAQSPLPADVDRPTQRWLPLPEGEPADLSELAQLLQQLRNQVSGESSADESTSPLPKLTEKQLREMEKAFESVREHIGEDMLPNLESIPKEWIDQALADPALRKQAQQMLEQYARDRKLPSPLNRTPLNSDGIPFPRKPSNNKTSESSSAGSKPTPDSPSNSSSSSKSNSSRQPRPSENRFEPPKEAPGISPDSSRINEDQPSEVSRDASAPDEPQKNAMRNPTGDPSRAPSSNQSLPSRPDAERIEALQELFKKLKTIEGQRSSDPNQQKSPSSSSSKNAGQVVPNSNVANRASKPTSPSGSNNPGAITMPRNGSKPSPPPNGSQKSQSATPKLPSSNNPSEKGTLSPPTLQQPDSHVSNSDDPTSTPDPQSQPKLENPFENSGTGFPNNEPSSEKSGPGLRGSNSTNSGSRPNSSGTAQNRSGQNARSSAPGQQGPNTPPANPSDNKSSFGADNSVGANGDIKTQLERHGLGRTLQNIVEKTMREQGGANGANGNSTPNNKIANAQPKPKDSNAFNKATPPATSTIPPSVNSTANRPTPPTTTPPTNAAPTGPSRFSGLRDMAAQFWGAIRTAPSETIRPPSSPSAKLSGTGNMQFSWSAPLWLLLGLVFVAVLMLLLLARKRVVVAASAKESEAELAKVILTEGIRTRADVIRAFHRFVLRRAQPVANWWNHRFVAAKLSEASPQLKSVLSDLASVYENARYLPPEVPLSSEDIHRMQSALKQCASAS